MRYTPKYSARRRKVVYTKPRTNYVGLIVLLALATASAVLSVTKPTPTKLVSPIPDKPITVIVVTRTPTPKPTATPTKRVTADPTKQPQSARQKAVFDLIGEVWGKDAEVGQKIAFCESSYNPEAKNSGSSATGVFQIIRATFLETRKQMGKSQDFSIVTNPKENIETAYFLYKKRGTSPWNASKHCWSN